MPPGGGTAPWVPSEVPCGRQQLESQKTESSPRDGGARGAAGEDALEGPAVNRPRTRAKCRGVVCTRVLCLSLPHWKQN